MPQCLRASRRKAVSVELENGPNPSDLLGRMRAVRSSRLWASRRVWGGRIHTRRGYRGGGGGGDWSGKATTARQRNRSRRRRRGRRRSAWSPRSAWGPRSAWSPRSPWSALLTPRSLARSGPRSLLGRGNVKREYGFFTPRNTNVPTWRNTRKVAGVR